MTYLAEVKSVARIGQKAKAQVIGKRRSDGLWIGVRESTVDLPYSRAWYEKQLVLLEINNQGTVEEVIPGSDRLFEALRDWSLRLTRFDSDKADLELMRKSLEYQSNELHRREEDLKRREELMRIQEKSMDVLKQLAQDKLNAAEKQHEALTESWRHLHYKEEQLKKG